MWAIEVSGLTSYVHSLDEGMKTYLTGGSFRLPASIARKIILARSLALRPRLLIIDDFWADMEKQEKMRLLTLLLDKQFNWTVIIVSNDKDVITLCDKMLLMQNGEIIAAGTYEQIRGNEYLQKLTDLKA
jgi:ABC-type branched-subunit amino acid transport system ATPase component